MAERADAVAIRLIDAIVYQHIPLVAMLACHGDDVTNFDVFDIHSSFL
jgi:hypothetical protein